jgi:hypothetical protein
VATYKSGQGLKLPIIVITIATRKMLRAVGDPKRTFGFDGVNAVRNGSEPHFAGEKPCCTLPHARLAPQSDMVCCLCNAIAW